MNREEVFWDEKEEDPQDQGQEREVWSKSMDELIESIQYHPLLSAGEKVERIEQLNHFLYEWNHRFKQINGVKSSVEYEDLWNFFLVDYIDMTEILRVGL